MKTKTALKSLVLGFLVGCGSGTTQPVVKAKPEIDESQTLIGYLSEKTQNMSFEDKVDTVRQFIHFNSRHADNNYAFNDIAPVLNSLLKSFHDKTPTTTSLKCGLRSEAEEYILGRLGIKTRELNIYTQTGEPGAWGHDLIEVLNPDTGNWEVSDPSYNVYYLDSLNHRMSILELLVTDLNTVRPCDNTRCGWDTPTDEPRPDLAVAYLLDHNFFDAVYIDAFDTVFINTDRFDPAFMFPDIKVTLPELYSKSSVELIRERE